MRHVVLALTLVASPFASAATAFAQTTIVRDVRLAISCTSYPCSPKADFSEAEAILAKYRAANGDTSHALEALSWLGRAALSANRLTEARTYSTDAYDRAVKRTKTHPIAGDVNLENALGAAIEVQAHVRAAEGRRSDAVYFLRRELDTYRHGPLHMRIQKNINLLSLEGQPAPALADGDALGSVKSSLASLKGRVVVLFFWAHWCGDCKAQGPILSALLDRHRAAGLTIVAPTQRYGYTAKRAPATPAAELSYIGQVRDEYYAFLRDEAVPVSDANHMQYGVSTTPTLVVLDRQGIVQLYHPGTMTAGELEAVIKPLLNARVQQAAAPAGVSNYTRVDATVACAGATPVHALPELKKNGFAAVINFRLAGEPGANIEESKAVAAKVGLRYIHLPFQAPTPEIADAFLKAVADPANQPVYIHCAAANRVGAMWFIKRVKLDGWDTERAMKEAELIGLRSPNLKTFVLDYASAKTK